MTQPDSVRYRIEPGPDGQFVRHDGQSFGLGRHVNHDPRSRRYPFRAAAVVQHAVAHIRRVPIFDQGSVGSCTGNAGVGVLGTEPYYSVFCALAGKPAIDGVSGLSFDESGALALYHELTRTDDYPGTYPPDDTGSDGLTIGKVLTAQGIVPGYQHTFSLAEAAAALQQYPLMAGTEWRDAMFYPDPLGRVSITGGVDGGHEWILDEYVPAGSVASNGNLLSPSYPYVGGTSSWGTSWGTSGAGVDGGRFYLRYSDFGILLGHDGDVMVLVPPSAPPPQPTPVPDPGADVQALGGDILAVLRAHGIIDD